eukprot:Hpha_TRINITY_DN27726_c0_g1::TRINITY_DN27726_c0_g1_i1::g.157108::m.157108
MGETVDLGDGLVKVVLKQGGGAVPKAGQRVSVTYTGWLQEGGTKFDSSEDRGQTFGFTVGKGEVIKGWDRAVLSMRQGERARVGIPYQLAYGVRGRPPTIPARAGLDFEIEVLEIREPPP